MTEPLSLQTAKQLRAAGDRLRHAKVLVGLDGFVDTILHVVARRESPTRFTRMNQMADFGQKIKEAAGLSANIEMVTQMVKLGGNGPIMANALCAFSTPVTYIGNLGRPNLHPVFEPLARRAEIHSIAEPGYTDAVEFDDGKLMFGKHESLAEVNWNTLCGGIGEKVLLEIFSRSELVALVNWTMLTKMSGIFAKILARIAPNLKGEKRWIFFDLADPAKRTPQDIAKVLRQIARFEKYFRVILGLNLSESRLIADVLGLPAPGSTRDSVATHAAAIRGKLRVHTVVVHPTQFAAAADAEGSHAVAGPFTEKPKITTGAGDHFNAGFCLGRLLGCDLPVCLQLGVATSGFYVRNAKSPGLEDLTRFLHKLAT